MLNYRFRLTNVCNILKDFTDIQRKWALSENFLDAHRYTTSCFFNTNAS